MNRNLKYSSGNLAGLDRNRPGLHEASFTAAVRQIAIDKAHLHPAMEVGVTGAGTVLLGKHLARLVKHVHVVESSAQKVDAALRKMAGHANLQVHQGQAGRLPFPDASLDALFASLYLETCPDSQAAIAEMVRVLKPGGRLVVTEGRGTGDRGQETGDGGREFEVGQVRRWLEEADFVNLVVEETGECCATEPASDACCTPPKQEGRLFVVSGTRRVRSRELVQTGYAARAEAGPELAGSCCCSGGESVSPVALCCTPESVIPTEAVLDGIAILPSYSPSEMAAVPSEAAGISLGCGNPTALANLQPGEVVLDIGSGGGIDVFLAARKVGATGRVIGVDMTPAMLERARAAALKAGLVNVEFRQGYAEALPVEDGAVDVIISNCVINLTEDKGLAWREAYRVLRPGGRVEVSDVATDASLPPALRLDARGWAECVTGALPIDETVDLLKGAGFQEITTHLTAQDGMLEGTKVFSALISARK